MNVKLNNSILKCVLLCLLSSISALGMETGKQENDELVIPEELANFLRLLVPEKKSHECLNHDILDQALPPHTECTKVEDEDDIFYTFYWNKDVACLIEKDGPVTILDHRQKPSKHLPYPDLEAARGPLSEILNEWSSRS